jgi:hypothetical protein
MTESTPNSLRRRGGELKSTKLSMLLRPHKKYVIIAACLVVFLLLGFNFRSSRADSEQLTSIPHSSAPLRDANEESSKPLLGAEEIPAALWFPSRGSDFRPGVPGYNAITGTNSPRLRTPLFISFTRNQALLEQAVLSYISAGWPREDIIVVDNSGTFDANNLALLSKSNPFSLNYDLLRSTYGISILQTPTLFTFAQLMNLYLRTAIAQNWTFYFWSHQDVAVLSDETSQPYKSFHQRAVEVLNGLGVTSLFGNEPTMSTEKWAVKFFAYDWLTLVNVEAWRTIGQWDTFIPYYTADCDAYSRVALHGFTKGDAKAGHIFDVSEALSSPTSKFFSATPSEPEAPNSHRFQRLKKDLEGLMNKKWIDKEAGRNDWQSREKGGKGEPWTYDPTGFQSMWWETANHGRSLYAKKWGTGECRLEDHGITLRDEFKAG